MKLLSNKAVYMEKLRYSHWSENARFVKEVSRLNSVTDMVSVGNGAYVFTVSMNKPYRSEAEFLDELRIVAQWRDKASWKTAYRELRHLLRYEPTRLLLDPIYQLS